jgi:hypothetical protein
MVIQIVDIKVLLLCIVALSMLQIDNFWYEVPNSSLNAHAVFDFPLPPNFLVNYPQPQDHRPCPTTVWEEEQILVVVPVLLGILVVGNLQILVGELENMLAVDSTVDMF